MFARVNKTVYPGGTSDTEVGFCSVPLSPWDWLEAFRAPEFTVTLAI
jgi:hypothetical protein